MAQELEQSLDVITNKLNRIIELLELSSPKTSKELLLEAIQNISTCSAYNSDYKKDMLYSVTDPNSTNNDVGLPGGVYQFGDVCGDKLCECGK